MGKSGVRKVSVLTVIVISLFLLNLNLALGMITLSDITVTMVSQSPDPVEPGQVVDVKFKLENEGQETGEDVIVKMTPKYPFSMYGDDEEKNVGKIKASSTGADAEYAEFTLKVDDGAVEGEFEIEVELVYGDISRKFEEGTFMIDIETHDAVLVVSSIEVSPETVNPGQIFDYKVNVVNTADSLLKDVVFKLELDDDTIPLAPYQSSSEIRISQLETNSEEGLDFKLISSPDAELGLYKIPVNISYNDELGKSYSVEDLLSITIGSTPDLKVYVKKAELLRDGEQGTFTIEIANTGVSNVKFLELEMLESEDYKLISTTNYYYLGELDSDDTESEEISVYAYEGSDSIQIPISIKYFDDNNVEYSEELNLELDLFTEEELRNYNLIEQSNSGLFVVLLLLVVLSVLYYYKRKKKQNKND